MIIPKIGFMPQIKASKLLKATALASGLAVSAVGLNACVGAKASPYGQDYRNINSYCANNDKTLKSCANNVKFSNTIDDTTITCKDGSIRNYYFGMDNGTVSIQKGSKEKTFLIEDLCK